MENVIDGGCTNSNLILNVKKKIIRFKPAADLTSSVNEMTVDVIEELDDKFETLVVSISLGQQQCVEKI
jgi:hypothetical protein